MIQSISALAKLGAPLRPALRSPTTLQQKKSNQRLRGCKFTYGLQPSFNCGLVLVLHLKQKRMRNEDEVCKMCIQQHQLLGPKSKNLLTTTTETSIASEPVS